MPTYTNPGIIEFDASLVVSSGGGAWVEFPYEVEKLWGAKRIPMQATFDGVEYRGSLGKMRGSYKVLMLKEIREQLGKVEGDVVHVTVQLDKAPRVIIWASDIRAALKSEPEAEKKLLSMAFTHQREYHLWIEEAKQPETRARRVLKMIDELKR